MRKIDQLMENVYLILRAVMLKYICLGLLFMSAQVSAVVFVDYNNIRDDELIDKYKYLYQTIAGDIYNPATGKVDFSTVDIDLPGNNSLPVRLERWIPDSDMRTGGPVWKWKIPLIQAHYNDKVDEGWAIAVVLSDNGWRVGENCDSSSPVSTGHVEKYEDSYGVNSIEFFEGVLLHIPGATTEKFLENDLDNGDLQMITKSNYLVDNCVYNEGTREQGFEVLGPDGTRYTFNEFKSYQEAHYSGGSVLATGRYIKLILATKVEDRFGNTVTYSYDNDGDLETIYSSDGRRIDIKYSVHTDETGHELKLPDEASANGRTWKYNYKNYSCNIRQCNTYLSSVDLPGSGGSWKYSAGIGWTGNIVSAQKNWLRLNDSPDYTSDHDSEGGLCQLYEWVNQTARPKITTPAGLVNTYNFEVKYRGRSKVDPAMWRITNASKVPGEVLEDDDLPVNVGIHYKYYATNLNCSANLVLVSKETKNLNGETKTWDYDYSQNVGTYVPDRVFTDKVRNIAGETSISVAHGLPSNIPDAEDFRYVSVTSDERIQYYYIDRKFQSPTEGQVVAEDIVSVGSDQLQMRKEFSFEQAEFVGNHWFHHLRCGTRSCLSENSLNANSLQYRINRTKDKLYFYNSGVPDVYETSFLDHDIYGNLNEFVEENSFSDKTRYTKYGILNDKDRWILGLRTTVELGEDDSNYITVEETVYHSGDNTGLYTDWYLPYELKRFGTWVRRYPEYHTTATEPLALGSVKRVEANELLHINKNQRSAKYRFQDLSNYKSGRPQLVTMAQRYSDSDSETMSFSRVVDENGWTTRIIDLNTNFADYGYDDFGRLRFVDLPSDWADYLIQWSQEDNEAPIRTATRCKLNASNDGCLAGTERLQSVSYYDGYMRVVKQIDTDLDENKSRYQNYTYDWEHRPLFTSWVSDNTDITDGITNTYDTLGRLRSVTETYGGTITYNYRAANTIQVTDANDYITTTQYLAYGSPAQGQPITIISGLDGSTSYDESGFDISLVVSTNLDVNVFGDIESITQSGPNKYGSGTVSQTEYRAYDAMHNLCKISRQDVGTTVYTKNYLGEVLSMAQGVSGGSNNDCDRNADLSKTMVLKYDNMGSVWLVDYPDSTPDLEYVADNLGNVTDLFSGSTQQSYKYNDLRLIESESLILGARSWDIDYKFDGLGSLEYLTYPDDDELSFTPNGFGQPTEVKRVARPGRAAFTYVEGVDYYPSGQADTFSYGNGLIHKTTLNSRNLPKEIKDYSDSFTVLNYSYSYDNVNNIKTITDKVDSKFSLTDLQYDGLNRLISTAGNSGIGSSTIRYDGLGNITYYASQNRVLDYTYVNHKLDSVSGSGNEGKNYSFKYDGRGNVSGDGTRSFTFNLANQLSSSGGNSYVYDGFNRRIKAVDSNDTSEYSFYSHGGQLLYREVEGNGVNYIYLGDRLVAKDGITPQNSGKQHYRPYGSSIEGEQDDAGYTGHKFDTDLGLSYMQARYYDPVIGRFLSNDPVGFLGHLNGLQGPQGFNRYAYVNNNPYRYIDPDGRALIGLSIGFGGTIPFTPITFGLSATVAIDHKLDTTTVVTPEYGGGTPGGSAFLRGVFGLNPGHTVDDLHGGGISASANLGCVSVSATAPGSTPADAFPIIEVGGAYGGSGASVTYGEGMAPTEFVDSVADKLETIKDFFTDPLDD